MKTADVCRREVVTVISETPLAAVARAMRQHHVGCVVVISPDERKPLGIVTDRDIVLETLAADVDARTLTAGDIMSRNVVTAREEDDVSWSLKVMRDRGVRRLPVVDAHGKLSGIVALDDLVQEASTALMDIVQTIGTERVVEARSRKSALAR